MISLHRLLVGVLVLTVLRELAVLHHRRLCIHHISIGVLIVNRLVTTFDTGFSSRLILTVLHLLGLLELVLESHRALRLSVAHDYDSSLRIVPELDWESSHSFRRLRYARLTINVSVG